MIYPDSFCVKEKILIYYNTKYIWSLSIYAFFFSTICVLILKTLRLKEMLQIPPPKNESLESTFKMA